MEVQVDNANPTMHVYWNGIAIYSIIHYIMLYIPLTIILVNAEEF